MLTQEQRDRAAAMLTDAETYITAGDHARGERKLAEFDQLVTVHGADLTERRRKIAGKLPEEVLAGRQDADGDEGARDRWQGSGRSDAMQRELRSNETWSTYLGRTGRAGKVDESFHLADLLRGIENGATDERARIALEASRESRDQLMGSDTQGGFMVPLGQLMPVIEPLRNRTTVIRAGARTIPVGPNTKWPVQTGDPVVSPHGEGGTIGTTTITFGRLDPGIYTFSAIVKCSRELLEDAQGVEDVIGRSYGAVAALKIDEQALYGVGAASPMGISNFSGRSINDLSGAKLSANGWWDTVLDLRGSILAANGNEPTSMIVSTREETAFSKLKDGAGLPYPIPPALSNVTRYSTTQVSTTEGAGSNESRIFLGDFRELAVLIRTDVTITRLNERYADAGQVGFWFWLRFGIVETHEDHFGTVDGILAE